jgi:hypothetical protein
MSVTVPTSTRFRYEGNGVTDTFAYDARVFEAEELVVEIITRATDELEDTLTLTTDYSVTINANGTASVTVVPAEIPSVTQDIQIRRSVPRSQDTVFPTGSVFPAKAVEEALDRLTVIAQDVQSDVDRSVKLPNTSSLESIELPVPSANKLIGWNSAGDELQNYAAADVPVTSVTAYIQTLLNDTTSAEARTTLEIPFTPASSSTAAYLDFAEDTDNGSNRARLIAPASLGSNADITLPSSTGTLTNGTAATSWTPVFTCGTVGDLSVTYSTQVGQYVQIGNLVIASFRIVTSAFTHTTASGSARITGLPFAIGGNASLFYQGALKFSGYTKANYPVLTCELRSGEQQILLNTSGSGQATASAVIGDFPTGGTLNLVGTVMYFV